MRKNSNQYEKSSFKAMQYEFWQTVIGIGGKYAEFDISADFLQHSLEKVPTDIVIKKGKKYILKYFIQFGTLFYKLWCNERV
ncbi:MAG: hypothetical protein J6O41_05940 [Clostridia bacterium]|nr:hypothetical protein [Clostridia bacterium]